MGEARRRMETGLMTTGMPGAKPMQINIDLKTTPRKVCECGCKYFIPVVSVYLVSALISPTGQEMMAQVPALVCMECKKPLGNDEIKDPKGGE